MTDKELLEDAAKAAGYPIPNPVGRYPTSGFKEDGTFYWRSGDDYREERTWNPLENDGDAFRLMADLMLVVKIYRNCVLAENIDDYASRSDVDGGKRNKAARRAIVKIAAEIGRDME